MRIGLLFCFCLLTLSSLQANDWRSKINPEILAELEAGNPQEIIVFFTEQADLSGAASIKGKTAKAAYVYEQVHEVAFRTQGPARIILDQNRIVYQRFAIVNAIYAQVDLRTARQLAELPGVRNLQPNPWAAFDQPTIDRTPVNDRNVLEWGLEKIQADEVWEMGFQGEGIVVGGQDTGYEWEHPAIKGRYRGWDGVDADHNYHWHDAIHEINPLHNDSTLEASNNPCGLDVDIPCDDHNHGTHTMGTMVGDDGAGNQIGVAPMASWIGCRNMERGWGSPASYIECFDWFLAPTDLNDENPDPGMAPHVINNSWGCPPVEGCEPENFALMQLAVDALKAAGVVVVTSAGNSGSSCGSVDDPAAIFANSFTVGASRSNDTIANFSSRGAVMVDSSFRLKPNVVAPGVGVRSCIRNGGYATWNGTSMAGPHVAGAVALLLSAAPHLEGEVELIETLFEETARPLMSVQDCGPFPGMAVPNAVYGYGRIDVLAAVAEALAMVDTDELTKTTVRLFPNPTTDRIYITGWDVEEDGVFILYNAQGQLVRKAQLQGANTQVQLHDLPSGTYTYRMVGDAQAEEGKIVIAR